MKGGWPEGPRGFRPQTNAPLIRPLWGHLPLKGKAGRAHTVRLYKAAGRSSPHPALRATFPPVGGRQGAPGRRAPRR